VAWLSIHAEGKVAESEPVRRSDVVREQDEASVDELPTRGQTKQMRAQWMTINNDTVVRPEPPQLVPLFDDDASSQPSVVENQPSRRTDVIREEDDMEAEVLLKRGFARDLAGFWSAPRDQDVTTVPRETVDMAALRSTGDSGVVENQPQRLEGVVRADDPADDESLSIERGLTRSLATQWSTRQDASMTFKQPFRMELDVDPNETAVFENEPQALTGVIRSSEPVRETMGQRGQIRNITMKYTAASPADTSPRRPPAMVAIDLADGPAVLENEPAAVDPSVVRSVWTDVDEGVPQPGMTRSMLQRWTSQQDLYDAERSTSTKPAWLADWETTPEGSGVFENTPVTREDVTREEDYEPEVIPVRQTRRTRAMWGRLERDDGLQQINTTTPEVRLTQPTSNCVITSSCSVFIRNAIFLLLPNERGYVLLMSVCLFCLFARKSLNRL